METVSQVHFIDGPIKSEIIECELNRLENMCHIGAHQIFLGRVRADNFEGQCVTEIDFSMHSIMAKDILSVIIEDTKKKFRIWEVVIFHSTGKVQVGKVCLFVMVSSAHRTACHQAIDYCVERLKSEAPIFGKEILENKQHIWKVNH